MKDTHMKLRSDGKIYKLSEKLYRKTILEGCGYNDENSDNK